MKDKITKLEERITRLTDTLGEFDYSDVKDKPFGGKSLSELKTVTDSVTFLNKEIIERESSTQKNTFAKLEELLPVLEIDKLKVDRAVDVKEMFFLLSSNIDELGKFAKQIVFLKENEKILDLNPVIDADKKFEKIRPLELEALNLETDLTNLDGNIDNMLGLYSDSVNNVNKKLLLYDKLLRNLEKSN